MDFNGSKLGDIEEVMRGYKSHRITLINDHKAHDKDIEMFIMQIILSLQKEHARNI